MIDFKQKYFNVYKEYAIKHRLSCGTHYVTNYKNGIVYEIMIHANIYDFAAYPITHKKNAENYNRVLRDCRVKDSTIDIKELDWMINVNNAAYKEDCRECGEIVNI